MTRLTVEALQTDIGVTADGSFGPKSRAALFAKFSNPAPLALTDADLSAAATRLGVPVGHIKGIRHVEAPRGAFDDHGRPSILYERHKFAAHTLPPNRFNGSNPTLSGAPYGAGGYGPYAAQYDRLASACALDPEAGFAGCSWGAFQVMGENAQALGYDGPYDMAKALVTGEAAHLDCLIRFLETNGLVEALKACRPGDPKSCQPFVSRYNGAGYRQFNYDVKLAAAIVS